MSALNVSIRAQILNLLEDMKRRYGLTLLFIAHDLAVVKAVSDRIAVMYLGRLCEVGPTEQLFAQPAHPYTALLLEAIPVPDPSVKPAVNVPIGEPPSPLAPPSGCRFRTRCPRADAVCADVVPPLTRDRQRPVRRLPSPADRPLSWFHAEPRRPHAYAQSAQADGRRRAARRRHTRPLRRPVAAGRPAAGHRPSAARRRAPTRRHLPRRAPRPGRIAAWQRLTYAEAWARTGAVASWLIAQGFGPDSKPIAILSDNSLENALLVFGALRAGALVAPISPNYSLSGDFTRLDHALSVVEPGLVFAQDSARYAAALDRTKAAIVTVDGKRGLAFGALASCSIDASVAERRLHITADTPAKILFTSGSTGLPKGVLNTHGNLAAAAEMNRSLGEPLDENRIGVSLDWLPWHHTWGGNSNLNGTVRSAGSLYIDGGRPVPGRFQETLENLRELSPSGFATVPAAYPLLLEALERDEDLRQKFFKNLRGLGYGGALLPQESFDRLQGLAAGQLGERLPFACGWGMTETTSVGLMVYWNVDRSGLLGLPPPSALAKLVPAGDRYELRVKGPHVMAGYYNDPAATAAAFDEEGFFKTGDAARWVDESNPVAGIAFAGRLSEEFKLASGTWVRATTLRTQLIDALQP